MRSIVGNTGIADGEWHHIAICFHPDTSTSTKKVYVDGTDDTDTGATDYLNTGTADSAEAGVRLHLGYDTSTQATAKFTGVLDEVAIWGRTLSATEIANIHANGDPNGTLHKGLDTRAQLPTGLLFHASMDVFLEAQADSKYKQAHNLLSPP